MTSGVQLTCCNGRPSGARAESSRRGGKDGPMSGAHDLAGADARGARVDPATVAGGDERPHGLDVRVPTARRAAVRVRHRHTETGPLATDIAHGSHGGSLLGDSFTDGGTPTRPHTDQRRV